MLADADRFAAQNKGRLRAIIDRYWQVQRKAEGTQWEAEAKRKEAAAKFNAVQAKVIADCDRAAAAVSAAAVRGGTAPPPP